ncbi:uncharacterized protein LOC130245913 [Danio aesculapii]|uniref:uncharacterized protein LOC130245913 n=1 Tax=Danio aesculapii TaxID=1142201 RepID=UPI0024C0DE7A|nr:uncharacterized protein LOC130245913 [Danio aesculapii]
MEFSRISLLTLIFIWDFLCVFKHNAAAHADLYERNSEELLETMKSQIKHLQVRNENSLIIHAGETLTLKCRDSGSEVDSLFWHTPFGQFEGCNHQNKDPVEICNSSLKISRATSSHDGLFFCIREDKMSKTITPYRINVIALNPNIKKRLTTAREAEVNAETVSESVFVAAVASSVIVSFLVAFTLGALTRSYVMTCLQTIRVHLPFKKDNINEQNNLHNDTAQPQSVFFKKNDTEDTVDIGFVDDVFIDDVVEIGGNDEGNQQTCEGDEETREFRSVVSPHPKKKARVIKVYNYDEEGNRFSHIKDSEVEDEEEVRPKLRTRSLTRLDAIMKRAETLDFNPVSEENDGQSTEPDQNIDATVSQF